VRATFPNGISNGVTAQQNKSAFSDLFDGGLVFEKSSFCAFGSA
jgi:hypothetical protein